MSLRILKVKGFAGWACGEGLADRALCAAAREIESGLYEAALGAGLLKKRVALPGRGKRGGARVLLAYRLQVRLVFLHGFLKNERDDIDHVERAALRRLAKELLEYSSDEIQRAVSGGALVELRCDERET
jgi:hypothetical protein